MKFTLRIGKVTVNDKASVEISDVEIGSDVNLEEIQAQGKNLEVLMVSLKDMTNKIVDAIQSADSSPSSPNQETIQ